MSYAIRLLNVGWRVVNVFVFVFFGFFVYVFECWTVVFNLAMFMFFDYTTWLRLCCIFRFNPHAPFLLGKLKI